MDDNTKRDRIFTFVRGANSFVSGEALSDNPYDRGPDFGDPKAWIAGWRYAEQSDSKQFSILEYGHLEQLAKRLIEKNMIDRFSCVLRSIPLLHGLSLSILITLSRHHLSYLAVL